MDHLRTVKGLIDIGSLRIFLIAVIMTLLPGCLGYPESISPVREFDLQRYLGKWYEIARLDHSFERGLGKVTAEYTLREDGGVRVLNRGYSSANDTWEEAEGKAYFVREPDEAYLKVSFFGPFYASYVVFELDREHYRYAFVSGPDKSYLWFLSRTPTVSNELMRHFVATADKHGFKTDQLIYLNH